MTKLNSLVEQSIHSMLTLLIYLALTIAVAHYLGWLDRWIWFVMETEAKKILNSTKVTLGSFEIDWSQLLQGKITLHASNVIVHTPKRDEWQWESPLIARAGKASVECNAPITIFHAVFFRIELPIEAYTIIVSDVQVFVERRDSVINVYLLNPTLILPPPPERKAEDVVGINRSNARRSADTKEAKIQDTLTNNSSNHNETCWTRNNNSSTSVASAPSQGNSTSCNAPEETSVKTEANNPNDNDLSNEQAKILVNEMLHAVQDLGIAATRGELPGALKMQGLDLVDRLRGFRRQENLEEGIRVMQQVGKVAVESLQSAPQRILPKPDTNKAGKPVYVRVGRILINDMRIFTKDSWIKAGNGNDGSDARTASGTQNKTTTSAATLNGKATGSNLTVDNNNNKKANWNKPIFIERMVVRASELSPPMSMKDDQDLPAIYQKVDRVAEIVWRRLLAEMAKSNTGKLFSTVSSLSFQVLSQIRDVLRSNSLILFLRLVPLSKAMGEVLSVMIHDRQSGNATTTISGATSTGTQV
jgi:hypothetical protein